MTLRTRLALGLLAIGLLLVIPLAIARRSLQSLDRTMNGLRREEFGASLLLGRMRGQTDDLRSAELSLFAVRDTASLRALETQLSQTLATADSLRGFGLDSAASRIEAALGTIPTLAPLELAAAVRRDAARSDSLSDAVRAAIERADRMIAAGERELNVRTQTKVDRAAIQSEQTQQAAIIALALAALVATIVGSFLVRSISDPVQDLERGMEAVAGGEFSHRLRVKPNRSDEFGRLAASYHTMSAQLAELDKLKAEFVSVASHELKTPINVIGGYLQLLEEGVYGPLTEPQREVCVTIAAQCEALSRLVGQLLDVSRFEAGGGKIEPRRFALGPFLDELDRAFHVLAMQRGANFHVERAVGLPDEVTWDADRINEVLGNLLSNAFKFTPRGGTVHLTAEPDERGVKLTVRDTGAGIPPAQLPHIFKKFYQADNQSAASAKGTGLGLAISRGIVDAHRGSIAVDSKVGVGTTFTIVLPEHVRPVRRATPLRVAAGAGA